MEYKIVMGDNAFDVEKDVRDLIADGWEPSGGISVAMSFETGHGEPKYCLYSYAQAMTKTVKFL